MSKKQFTIVVVLVIVSGLIGGAMSSWIFSTQTAIAATKSTGIPKEIVANSITLCDETGEARMRLRAGRKSASIWLIYDDYNLGSWGYQFESFGPLSYFKLYSGKDKTKITLMGSNDTSFIGIDYKNGNSAIQMIHLSGYCPKFEIRKYNSQLVWKAP